MKYNQSKVIQIKDQWFIETRTGYDGPFDTKSEAKKFHKLLKSCDAARCEFAGLDFSPT